MNLNIRNGPGNAPTLSPDSDSGKRAVSRHVQQTLKCNLGDVLDISIHGMRVRCMRMPRPRTDVILTNFTEPGQLHGNVVWAKKAGNFHHEIGLKFEKVSGAMQKRLAEIAKNHRFRRAL